MSCVEIQVETSREKSQSVQRPWGPGPILKVGPTGLLIVNVGYGKEG